MAAWEQNGLAAAMSWLLAVLGGLDGLPAWSRWTESTARSTGSVSLAAASLVSGSSWIDAGLRVSRSVQVAATPWAVLN